MVEILTDSCADLSSELIDRFKLRIVPLSVFIDGKTFHDSQDIQTQELFNLVEKTGTLPKTSAPSLPEFYKFFNTCDQALCICIGSALSATFQNATLAARGSSDHKIVVIDSRNLSTGIGLLVLKAAELNEAGSSLSEIVTEIEATAPKVHTSFIIDTLDYLYKGGRCSALESIAGSLLKIHPVIEVRPDGTMGVKEKIRGSRKKSLEYLLDDFKAHLSEVDLHRVFVTHTGCDEDADYLKKQLLAMAPIEEVCITTAGATIASHCGPNTIGVLYISK
jgi:DegV family protein with EDD domain